MPWQLREIQLPRPVLQSQLDEGAGPGKPSVSGLYDPGSRASMNQPSRNEGVKLVRCLCAASVLQALIVATELRRFGCVDSPQANARPVNCERIAINDAGLPGQIVRLRC